MLSWLRQRDIGDWNGYAPAPMTAAKQEMIDANESTIDRAVRLVLDCWDDVFVEKLAQARLKQILADVGEHYFRHRTLPNNWQDIARNRLSAESKRFFHGSERTRVDGAQLRYRMRIGKSGPVDASTLHDEIASAKARMDQITAAAVEGEEL